MIAGCSGSDESGRNDSGGGDGPSITLEAVSTRAEMVSGGDVLVRARAATGSSIDGVKFLLGDREVTDRFQGSGDVAEAYLDGLVEGDNELTAKRGKTELSSLELTNHPISGPIFSGPHQTPFACTTELAGLGAPTDANCSAPTRVRWAYFPATPDAELIDLDDPTSVPADVAMIDRDGAKVPFIIRIEEGVIDRSIYEFAVLESAPDPTAAPRSWDDSGWNRTLLYEYGGGCGTGFTQGKFLGHELRRGLLEQGYANVTSTLNVMQTTCNDVLSAEVTMMMIEHITETYGEPTHVIGTGGSGGAIQQLLIAQNYPGLLDAITPALPFPDAVTIAAGVTDCGLLAEFWRSDQGSAFTDEQRLAVQGHGDLAFCRTWISSFLDAVNPTTGCAGDLDPALVYDPQDNPTGARCTLQDANANLYPPNSETGFAERPLDNVGVQYGWEAVLDKLITVDQFLDLNENVGGYDIDGQIVPARHEAPEAVVEASYRNGRALRGDGELRRLPVLLMNPYTDLSIDIHDRFRAFSIRDRMSVDGVRATNEVIWTRPGTSISELVNSTTVPIVEMVDGVQRWLEALDQATAESGTPTDDAGWQARLAKTRPKDLTDDCVTADGTRLAADDVYDTDNVCTREYVIHGDPRTAAGAARRNDVIKCALQPVDASGYAGPGGTITFTSAQAARLESIFPGGVCDWDAPGVGVVPLDGTWRSYS